MGGGGDFNSIISCEERMGRENVSRQLKWWSLEALLKI